MCYHVPKDGYDLYFRPGRKANTRGTSIWHMKKVKEQLGKEVCRNLLFLHAITGCDTASRFYGVGKATVLKKLENVLSFKEQAMSSAVILLFPTLPLQVKKHLYLFLMVKNLQARRLILSHKIYIVYGTFRI